MLPRPLRLLAAVGAALLFVATVPASAAPASAVDVAPRVTDEAIQVPAGGGRSLQIERDPFRLVLQDADGTESVATVPGAQGVPVRAPGVDGPQPEEPLGALGGAPGVGFVVGVDPSLTFPIAVPFFTGNRLFGAEFGAIATVVAVSDATVVADGVDLQLALDVPGVAPVTAQVRQLPDGGVSLRLAAPDDLPDVTSTVVTFDSPEGEPLFGLGGRKDAFDQRGLLRNVWVEQQNVGAGPFAPITNADPTGTTGETYTFPNGAQATHFPQSVLFGGRGWAAWLRDSQLQRVDLAASLDDRVRWATATDRLELVLFGGGLEEASRQFTAAEGRAPAPPRYAYEPWLSVLNEGEGEAAPFGAEFTGGERVRADLEEAARMIDELDLPIGVLGAEGWHRIPDVEELTADLRDQGFRLQAYWSPFVNENSEVFDEVLEQGYLVRDPTGQPYPIVTTRGFVNHLVDFTDPDARTWWGDQLARAFDLGFEAFMHDFGELVTEGMEFASGQPWDEVHNLYPSLYHRAASEGSARYAAAHPGFEPFFYVRAGMSGTPDAPGTTAWTASAFPGDETTDDDRGFGLPAIVPMMLNLALGGSYAFTTDVGGYLDLLAPRTTPELFVRWHQASALMPINRIHNSTFNGSFVPWELDDELLEVYRRFGRLKVELIDLVDDWAQRAARDGVVGPVRPLVLDDPSSEAAAVADQWLLGTDLLVAPVLEVGATERSVYLPVGEAWERVTVDGDGRLVPTGEVTEGGVRVDVAASLHELPLFVRVGGAEPLPFATPTPAGPDRATAEAGAPVDVVEGRSPASSASPLPVTGGTAGSAIVLLLLAGALGRRPRPTGR